MSRQSSLRKKLNRLIFKEIYYRTKDSHNDYCPQKLLNDKINEWKEPYDPKSEYSLSSQDYLNHLVRQNLIYAHDTQGYRLEFEAIKFVETPCLVWWHKVVDNLTPQVMGGIMGGMVGFVFATFLKVM